MTRPGDLPGVHVLPLATIRGKTYMGRDHQDIRTNFERWSAGPKPALRVPVVLGHSEDQELLKREGLPAAAWVKRLTLSPAGTHADFEDAPRQVRRLVNGRAYRTVSPEIYDAPPASLFANRDAILAELKARGIDPAKALADAKREAPARQVAEEEAVRSGQQKRAATLDECIDMGLRSRLGKMMRRVAMLGGDVPEFKTLDEIPVFDDRHESFASTIPQRLSLTAIKAMPEGVFAVFSEVRPMDETQNLLEALAKHGLDMEALQGVSAPALAEILRVLEAKNGDAAQPGGEPQAMAEGGEENEIPPPKDDAEKSAYAEKARKFFDLSKKYAEHCGLDMSKHGEDEDEEPDGDEKMPEKMSEIVKAVKQALQQEAKSTLATLEKFKEETLTSEKRRAVDGLIERWGRDGKLPPREQASVRARLLRADTTLVHKFSEGGKEITGSDFDLQCREIESRPTRFGELFATPQDRKENEDRELAAVERFHESNSAQFAKIGYGLEALKKGFQAAKKSNPSITAEEFLRAPGQGR